MDSDEIMSDLAGPANVTSEDDSETKQGGAAAWNTKKFREEYEHQKNRLQDQDFSVANYPDPLAPRPPHHPKQYPKGTGPELERKLQELIAEAKAGSGDGAATAAALEG